MKYLYFFTFICIFGCNNEDPVDEVTSLPSEFDVAINVFNFYRATVTWEEATSTLPNPIAYDLYLNDNLIEDSLTERVYELEELQELSNYTLKIIAKNEIGETPIVTEFSTPEKKDVRLVNLGYVTSGGYLLSSKITYNDNNQILSRTKGFLELNQINESKEFLYNEDDLLISDVISADWYGARVIYQYENGQVSELDILSSDGFSSTTERHSFSSPTNYTIRTEFNDAQGSPEIKNYIVELTFNSSENLIEYYKVNTDNGNTQTINFEYENGNLTKVSNAGDVFEITYNDANNFHTYHSGLSSHFYHNEYIETAGFLHSGTSFPFSIMSRIPHFFTYNNKNNPVEYILNGEVVESFEYEYNEYNYPSKVISSHYGETREMIITYEEID